MSCSSLPPPRRQCYEQTIIQVRLNGIRIGKIPGYSFLAIVLIGVYEAAYGMLAVRSSLGACGHFDNPAGFAAFLAALFPFTLYFIGLRQKLSVVFGMTAAAVLLFAIALSGSRAGWIAVLVVGIYYLWPRLFRYGGIDPDATKSVSYVVWGASVPQDVLDFTISKKIRRTAES